MQHDFGDDAHDAAALTQSGVLKAFRKSAVGDRANIYDNDKPKRFHAMTKAKRLTTKLVMGRNLAARKPMIRADKSVISP